jgi:hypothetical protein
MEATGDGRAPVSFGHSSFCLFLCDIDQKKNMTRCARTGEEEWTMRGSSGAYGVVEFDDEQPRVCGTPASYSGSLGARFGEEGRGKWRGACGVFIAAARHRLRQEIKRIEEGSNQRGNGLWRD